MRGMQSLKHSTMSQVERTKSFEQSVTSDDVVISVNNVSKKFCRNLRRSMLYGINDLSQNMFGMKPETTQLRKDEFWALDNVSFDLRRGETLGLVGANGSGKTTLLRLLTGIFPPDNGKIEITGRIGALIAVGAGFHPHMTGRENIYLNGTILGMKRAEIVRKFDRIVEFSEIGDFLDAPVSTYSSGMYVRLGFAIAIHAPIDILIVDEILAVGDAHFQRKCLNRIRDIRNQGAAIILVSHNMQNIEGMCSKAILFHHGKQLKTGSPKDVVPAYELLLKTGKQVDFEPEVVDSSNEESLTLVKQYSGFGTNEITLHSIVLKDCQGMVRRNFLSEESLTLVVEIESKQELVEAKAWISFIYVNDYKKDDENLVCLGAREIVTIPEGKTQLQFHFNEIQLTTGEYKIAFHIFDETFTTPYIQGHYGYFWVKKDIPTLLRVGQGTPMNWTHPEVKMTTC